MKVYISGFPDNKRLLSILSTLSKHYFKSKKITFTTNFTGGALDLCILFANDTDQLHLFRNYLKPRGKLVVFCETIEEFEISLSVSLIDEIIFSSNKDIGNEMEWKAVCILTQISHFYLTNK